MVCFIFETYNNSVMPHGFQIYKIAYNKDMSTIFTYPLSQNELPHWKYVICCCEYFTCIVTPSQELDNN